MPRYQRAFVIAVCTLIGAGFAYAACDWGSWPRAAYLPITGELTFHPREGSITMMYVGIIAWGVGGAACGALFGAGVCAVWRKPIPERLLQVAGAWAITAIVLAGSYYTWSSVFSM
ncbi:hypothetical protein BH11MYX1_BH11MYX1_33590 [soil metagenome]